MSYQKFEDLPEEKREALKQVMKTWSEDNRSPEAAYNSLVAHALRGATCALQEEAKGVLDVMGKEADVLVEFSKGAKVVDR